MNNDYRIKVRLPRFKPSEWPGKRLPGFIFDNVTSTCCPGYDLSDYSNGYIKPSQEFLDSLIPEKENEPRLLL